MHSPRDDQSDEAIREYIDRLNDSMDANDENIAKLEGELHKDRK